MANLKDEARSDGADSNPSVAKVDMKLEAVVIPVSDIDRAKQFHANLGWRLDADFPFDNGFRAVPCTSGPAKGPRQRDGNWPEWYAAYMVAEQAGKEVRQ